MYAKKLLEYFLIETDEHMVQLEKGILELEQNPSDTSGIHELFRTAHTLKGAAALNKLSTLSGIAHKMEDALEAIRDAQIIITKEIVDWLLHCLDSIKFLVSETAGGRPEKPELLDEISNSVPGSVMESIGIYLDNNKDGLMEAPAHSMDNEEEDITIRGTADTEGFSAAEKIETEEPAPDDYTAPETEAVEQETGRSIETPEAETCAAAENSETEGPVSDDYAVPETEDAAVDEKTLESQKTLAKHGKDRDIMSPFVKVDVDSLDKMMGLVGELTILKNFFISETEGVSHLRSEIEYACERLMKEIDDFGSRYAHAAPEKMSFVDSLLEDFRELEFDRYDGINLFANSIKEIMSDVNVAIRSISAFFDQFETHTTRLDKLNMEFRDIISTSRMVETGMLFQRFTRIVRELGIQTGINVKLVVAGGHTRIDRILYECLFTPLLHMVRNVFSHAIESSEERHANNKSEEGTIILSAKRDGNSVIIEIVDDGKGIDLKKVYQKAAKMGFITNGENVSEARLHNILFTPGFSTHDEIDMTSGRGVGLDAVRQTISEINGTISIASEEGQGTTFRITLPLTLIVVNSVKFRAGGLDFSVPSGLVQELTDIDTEQYSKDMDSMKLRGEEIPVKDLCNLLKLNPERSGKRIPVLVFNLLTDGETGLLIDEIIAQEDTVIKPLGGFLEGLRCYSGFSISGDARLSPVINPIGLLETQFEQMETVQEKEETEIKKNILVVDDSLSVRKFATILLEQNGFNVLTAPNGLEALTVIDENSVDFILTDLEMPVMHGYELLRELNRRGISETIPAAVLTSRSNEKHKEKAKLLGAKDYIVKPFQESSLVQTIRKHIKGAIIHTG